MTTLKDIESAILQLPDEEIHQLSAWLQDYLDDSWDKQIKNDLESGKLDRLLQKVNNDISNNQVKPLDEILNNS
ncbi:MAG: hypothetical protein EWV49_02695 [Microcystis aeruginosa Ma_QC_Ch_20071001_S25]|jgi:hypothetical protein|uniref:Addiction module component n=20 Tax=Microcystis TaxID=1125 RepID=S3JYZ7_MICAE|nr:MULTISPECIES: hypothetical protein [Microcystis]MCA2765417.1 hypothetical protein [Microcystis sp. M151S2]MCA2817640.1 hypothetical protein [Microcystis sp. M085S1]MCA2856852.1 hypothetical protein [Microcystis sp. M065S1]MCA2925707.1 hypothetical protein [Microcystis sp. M020S1]MCA2934639.1 hypothetical protein [Microcystis sp. M015S1]MCE2665182.1 hypothetical protein [Microcystis sp. 53602_E8]MCU7245005.1 hypothetical protein [Microcystis aeruginosa WS75]MCZ8053829.1 hypothetical prote